MGCLGEEYMHPSIGASIYFFVLLSCAFMVKFLLCRGRLDFAGASAAKF